MIYVDNSDSSNPYINLAMEEFLVRHADCSKHDYLLLYINQPTIILGKNQCIYKEVNFEFLRHPQLKLARRISGGGTVYHDPGNVNFAFITSFANEKINNYTWFNQALIKALTDADIPAQMDKRNNILCNGKKISGNAQFTNRKNIISHGTLLFNSDLPALRACLHENDFKVETRAVSSVKSPVMNMAELPLKLQSAEQLKAYLRNKLADEGGYNLSDKDWQTIHQLATDKFESFEWVYGRTPASTIYKPTVSIQVEHGLITGVENHSSIRVPNLKGVKYEVNSLAKAVEDNVDRVALMELLF